MDPAFAVVVFLLIRGRGMAEVDMGGWTDEIRKSEYIELTLAEGEGSPNLVEAMGRCRGWGQTC